MFEFKDLRVFTFNCQSIGKDAIRKDLFSWLKDPANHYDIICLQEIHVTPATMPQERRDKWAREWGLPCIFSDHCAILINHTQFTIHNTQELAQGRILTVDVAYNGDLNKTVRIINMYAPANTAGSVTPVQFVDNFPYINLEGHSHTIMLGDFNVWKTNGVDKQPLAKNDGRRTRWQVYEPLFARMGVSDIAPPPNIDHAGNYTNQHFTHTHTVTGGTQSRSRIDYIMVSDELMDKTADYDVRSIYIMSSDHMALSVTLNLLPDGHPGLRRNRAPPSLDTRILKEPEFCKEISTIITSLTQKRKDKPHLYNSPGEFWEECKLRFLTAGQQYQNNLRNRNRRKKATLQSKLRQADLTLDKDPNDEEALVTRITLKKELQHLDRDHLEHLATLAKIKWLEEGERASPFFTARLKAGKKSQTLLALNRADGTNTSDHEEMADIATLFYERLYTSEPTDISAQDTLLGCIPQDKKMGTITRTILDKDLDLDEIEKSIDSMDLRSSPGSDGLPYEFYKAFKQELAPILVELFNAISDGEGALPGSHHGALTILIFKKGDDREMKNYRPISLTQTDYKIFTKALTNRINPIASVSINPWQTGFIPGRQGHDNIMLMEMVLKETDTRTGGNAAILSLDQEKAYDRVEWGYLHRVLEAFGFGKRIRNWIRCCYSDLSGQIILNGQKAAPYPVARGLRQGDPLAPILFNYVLEPFLLYYNKTAKGIPTSDTHFKVAAFADDTNLGLGPGDQVHAQKAIRLHERASGAKINKEKSVLIPLSATSLQEIPMPGYATAAHRETFTHLGVKLRQGGRDMAEIETDTLAGLRRTIGTWHRRRLTKTARVVVANTYFLSKLWYVAPFYDFSVKFFDEIDRLLKLLIWDGKARVSLPWVCRPKLQGGLGLIHPRSQCVALRAKWIARWQEPGRRAPRWKPLFTASAQNDYGLRIKQAAEALLTCPMGKQTRANTTGDLSTPVTRAVGAAREIEVREGQNAVIFADKIPFANFTVKQARTFLMEKVVAKTAQTHKTKGQKPKDRTRWAPIFENMATQKVAVTLNGAHKDDGPEPEPFPDDFWTSAFKRIHSRYRHPKEVEFLWSFAHKAIWTNAIKGKFTTSAHHPTLECRRCRIQAPDAPAHIETRLHAFYFCPQVKQAWDDLRSWIRTLSPSTMLGSDPVDTILGWPNTKHVTPLLIHLHSVVAHSIYRTFCKLGDQEPIQKDELLWMTVLSFQRRAKTELVRAKIKDTEAMRNPRNTGNRCAPGPDDQFDLFKAVWHTPPHIEVTKEAVTFGAMWPRPPGHEAAALEPAPAPDGT